MELETTKTIDSILVDVFQHVKDNRDTFGDEFPTRGYPAYEIAPNNHWVAGFWPAMLWYTYHFSGDGATRARAEALYPSFVERLEKRVRLTHDLGFVYLLSCRAQWMLTGNPEARDTALRAAAELEKRYNPRGHYIQAWGEIGEPPEAGRIIVDCLMNLNLLYWASEQTGNKKYRDIARNHAATSQKYLVRDDSSTYHTFFFNPETGEPLRGETHQGYADESLWARGQAWAIYGFALSAHWLGDQTFLQTAQNVADRFLAESPADKVPLWDFRLPANAPQYFDSSAGAIAACGLLRLEKLTGNLYYRQQAETLVDSLINQCLEISPDRQGVLKHGAQHVPYGHTPDGYLIFGDYFFLEALLTLTGSPPDFWGPSQ